MTASGHGLPKVDLDQLIQDAPVLIYVKDPAGRYLYLNRQSELVTGISSEEVLGQTDFDLYPPETATEYRQEDLGVLEGTSPLLSRGRMLVGRGERLFSTIKFAVVDGEEVVGVCGISIETTHDPQGDLGATGERPSTADAYFGRLLASLTPQEVRVLDLVVTGLSDREIAAKLSLSNDTVRHHVSHLLKKLRKRRAQVIIEMLKRGRA